MDRRLRLTQAECEQIRAEAGDVRRLFYHRMSSRISPVGKEILQRLARKYDISEYYVSRVVRGTYRPREEYTQAYEQYHNYHARQRSDRRAAYEADASRV